MSNTKKVLILLAFILSFGLQIKAQQKIVNPIISYAANPQTYKLAGISVSGVDGYEDYVLIGISGLSVGQDIEIPGTAIRDRTNAVKRYWKHGLFSDVSIAVDSLVGDNAYLHIYLKARPRISTINYNGLKKSEREDMEQKLGIMKGGEDFWPIGSDKPEPPLAGEIAYYDEEGVICRCWNWRDGKRTEVTDDTTVEFIAMECVEPNRVGELQEAVDELANLLTQYVGAEVINKQIINIHTKETMIQE